MDALGGLSELLRITASGNPLLGRLPVFASITVAAGIDLQSNAALVEGPSFPRLTRIESGPIAIANNPVLTRLVGFSALIEAAVIEIRQNPALVEVDFGQLARAQSLQITCNLELADESLAPLEQVESAERLLVGNAGSEELCQPL